MATKGLFRHQHRPAVWGVVNVTPDSFSDGGQYHHVGAAIQRSRALVAAGADYIDVGGESTRPGSARVDPADEASRVLPVISQLATEGIRVSVDTSRADVAHASVEAGAAIINDVSGGQGDPEMYGVVAELGVPYVLMHWRAESDVMDEFAHYDNVVDEVTEELEQRISAALAAGVRREQIVVDPGFGFAKNERQNLVMLRGLPRFVEHFADAGFDTLVGTSRKRFLGSVLADLCSGQPRSPVERDLATAATSLLAAQAGAWAVRVHEVTPTVHMFAVHAATTRLQGHDTDG